MRVIVPTMDRAEWLDVRGDGGVLKRILRAGNAAAGLPIDGMCAKVNYDAYIEGGWFDGRQVDTTRNRNEEDGDFQFLLGESHEAVKDGWVIRGLNAGCETMHRGEKAEFIFTPEYAYGTAGSRAHPKVPPNSTLRYEVEMLTWKPALSDEKNMLDMPWQDRLELAYATKESANEHFREGQPEEARMRYWKAGMLMDVVGHKGTPVEMPPDRLEEQNALALTCWLNEAMCYIRMAQNEHETGRNCRGGLVDSATNPTLWRKAIASCDVALKYDEGNVKGHYRKGMAYHQLHEFDAAREHYTRALRGNPRSREIREALDELKAAHAASTQADARMFKKVMGTSRGLYTELPGPSCNGGANPTARANMHVWLHFAVGVEAVGRVELELWVDKLPRTCTNFRALCTGESPPHAITRRPLHYKGCPIHRVVKGLMIQGGDIICHDGRGGASIYGNYFADEGFEAKHDAPGLLSMANQGRDTNRSQFFITTQAAPHLDGLHVVFGRVLSGMEVVRRIEECPVVDDKPVTPVVIDECGEGLFTGAPAADMPT